MKGKNKLLIGIAAAIVLAGAAVKLAHGSGGMSVGTSAAVKGAMEDHYTEEGRITFGNEHKVIAQVSGPVGQIMVRENSRVEKGQVLFTIDPASYEYDKSLAQISLDGLQAQSEQSRINQVMTSSPEEYLSGAKQEMLAKKEEFIAAKIEYEGNKRLYSSGAVSGAERQKNEAAFRKALKEWKQAKFRYEESRRSMNSLKEEGIDQKTINNRYYDSEMDQLAAQIEAKKTAVSQLEDQIANCEVKAECDGIITSLPVKGMSAIQSGETAAVISSREGVEAEADVLTSIAPYIQIGSPVEVLLQLRGKDEAYTGKVSGIYDYASKGVSSLGLDEYRVHVKVALDDDSGLEERDGYGVNLKFRLFDCEDCLTIPSSAVFKVNDQYYAYEIKGGKAVKAPIQVEYQTGTKTVVSSGLKAGDRVITQVDSEVVYEGAKVKKSKR